MNVYRPGGRVRLQQLVEEAELATDVAVGQQCLEQRDEKPRHAVERRDLVHGSASEGDVGEIDRAPTRRTQLESLLHHGHHTEP